MSGVKEEEVRGAAEVRALLPCRKTWTLKSADWRTPPKSAPAEEPSAAQQPVHAPAALQVPTAPCIQAKGISDTNAGNLLCRRMQTMTLTIPKSKLCQRLQAVK